MYSWQHCGTGTLSYRQPRHFSNHGSDLKRQVIMVQFLSINLFCWISSIFVGFFKSSCFLSLCTNKIGSTNLKDRITTDSRNTPLATNPENEEIVDAPGNDGNASMLEQVKRPNPWRRMMMMKKWLVPFFYVLLTVHLSIILAINQLDAQNLVSK